MASRLLLSALGAASLLAAPALARPAPTQFFATIMPAPSSEAYVADCVRGRSVQTCVCMANYLQRSGEGQFVLETAKFEAEKSPENAMAAIFARHNIAATDGRAITRAGKAVRKVALGACR
jgi:hypothetical protein